MVLCTSAISVLIANRSFTLRLCLQAIRVAFTLLSAQARSPIIMEFEWLSKIEVREVRELVSVPVVSSSSPLSLLRFFGRITDGTPSPPFPAETESLNRCKVDPNN